ncbi:hypothetical protein BDF22DRAFT_743904 [Syncephalis plumigaleata]|nr:hypothetical protein BDF22DRAFT_743904 [Syncephalis plumigaleata]
MRVFHRSAHTSGHNSPRELTDADLLEIRALERTFDGAYSRTALNALGSGTVVLRLFSREFFGMGLVFVVFGLAMLVVNLIRQRKLLNQHRDVWMPFRTNGRYVVATCILALAAYITMLVLIISI